MVGYLSADIYLFLETNSYPVARGKLEQIISPDKYSSIYFLHQIDVIVFIILQQQQLGAQEKLSNKLDLLKRSRFLPRHVLLKFHYSVILPSVKYGIILWGSCTNSDLVNSVNSLHCRAARIIFNLPRHMPSTEVLTYAQ